MSKRVVFSISASEEVKKKLKELSEETRINQSKLVEEALQDLFKKYNK